MSGKRRGLRAKIGAGLIAATLGFVGLTACEPSPGGNIGVTSPDDWMLLSSRLIFSTVAQRATPSRSITVNNTGTSNLIVSNITITGNQASSFHLASGQATGFTIAAGATRTVSVLFQPPAGNPVSRSAVLNIVSNDGDTSSFPVQLKGINAPAYESFNEPQLQTILSTLGYGTSVGFAAPHQAETRLPFGDEVISPFWRRADTTKPATLRPLARYVGLTTSTEAGGTTNSTTNAHTATMFQFPPDDVANHVYVQNQKLLPAVQSGGTFDIPTNVSTPFGIFGAWINASDDQYNNYTPPGGVAGNERYHNLRFYPAENASGATIPNAWIVGVDVKTDPDKNYDYQDHVFLMTNATPTSLPADQTPGTATNRQFSSAVSGTVTDKDGQGTGFNSVMGTSTPALRDLDTASGTFRLTSTAGQVTGSGNDQVNGMQLNFNASRRASFRAETRLLNPAADITAGFQQKAVYFGPGQNDYVKLEIEHRTSGGTWITLLREEKGLSGTVGQFQIPSPSSVATLDLALVGNLGLGTVTGSYRINSDSAAFTSLGSYDPKQVMLFFASKARAGVLVSHTGSTTPIVGVFDRFVVS